MQGNTNIDETTWNETSMWEKEQIEKASTTIEQERNNINTGWWNGSRRTTNQNQKKKKLTTKNKNLNVSFLMQNFSMQTQWKK